MEEGSLERKEADAQLSSLLISFYLAKSQKDEDKALELSAAIKKKIEAWHVRTPGQKKRREAILASKDAFEVWCLMKGGVALMNRERVPKGACS